MQQKVGKTFMLLNYIEALVETRHLRTLQSIRYNCLIDMIIINRHTDLVCAIGN